MTTPVITVEDLRKSYREGWIRRRSLDVLKGISFTVGPGEIFGLLGPNGAGKTTFIKILLGIVRASGGNASLLGHAAGSRRSRRHVGYLPENLRIPRHHTGLTALNYYGQLSGLSGREIKRRGETLLQLVGLSQRAGDSITKYSKGMLQRLGLAQALLHEPQVVILDEPTDGLDPVGRSHVRNVLQQLKQEGRTVFVNSHILQEVELICDRVAILDRGSLRYVGPVAEVSRQGWANDPDIITAEAIELEIHFEVIGGEAAVRGVLAGLNITNTVCSVIRPGEFRVAVRVATQTQVDQIVDQFRMQGISIVGLNRQRLSLEDAFLAIVERVDES